MCDWTFLSNLFSVQSDCPHRERFGYGGDIAATSEALMMNYDMATFYTKTVRDWRDSALPDGMFTDTAPFVGIQYCGVAWAMVHPLLQRQLYQYYGNRTLIEEQYAAARRWLDRVTEQFPERIVTRGRRQAFVIAEPPGHDPLRELVRHPVQPAARGGVLFLDQGADAGLLIKVPLQERRHHRPGHAAIL